MAVPGLGSVHTSSIRTTDGVFGTSATALIAFAVIVKGGSATTLADITNGSDGSGTAMLDIIAPINDTITVNLGPNGLFFPGGAHLDITTTGGSVTLVYSQA
jgi:hypothetical protein|tara:strand:+ start:3602 stop:3907 length:306 start_codon:yes stop_codon:yes gene_type:complete